jgi:hypothetical protein
MSEQMIITGEENTSMTISEDEFIGEIQTELTVGCSLPFTVPKKEIQRIIKYAAKWFYKNYEDAVEERYGILLNETFQSDAFKRSRTITLPKCILSVFKVQKTGGEASFAGSVRTTGDFAVEKLFLQGTENDTASIGDGLMTSVIYMYWADLAASLVLYPITYNYNRNSNKLWLGGETPNGDLVLNVLQELPLEYLYKDEIFFDYIVAKTKTQLARILGTFQFNLVGNVTINYDLFQAEGNDRLVEIKEEIKSDEGTDWFFTSNSN